MSPSGPQRTAWLRRIGGTTTPNPNRIEMRNVSLNPSQLIPYLCSVLLLGGLVQAQEAGATSGENVEAGDDVLEGHSAHGSAFNEGPRQAAYLMHDRKAVRFLVTTEDEEAQRFFEQGIGQLHAFWYLEAERSFRHVAMLDPDCAMAYWGMAMANVEESERAAKFARMAWLKRGLVTEREQLYIDAVANFHGVSGADEPEEYKERSREEWKKPCEQLVKDYEEIVWEYPDDMEAKAFLVNRLWLNRRFGLPTPSRHTNEALLQQILAVHPDHPAHHYRIHLWDAKDSADHVVDTALAAGPSWPSAAHMWHMGGHIFARLGRHFDSAWQQEASARVDHAYMIRDWVLPDQIHNFAHNNEWLSRSLRHSGRLSESIDLSMNMIELPRHPLYNTLEEFGGSSSYARMRLLETLELFEQWDRVVELADTMYLAPEARGIDRGQRANVLAKAYLHRGDREAFEEQLQELESCLLTAKIERAEALDEAEEEALDEGLERGKVDEAMKKALDAHRKPVKSLRDYLAALPVLWEVVHESEELETEELEEKLALLEEHDGLPDSHLALLYMEHGLARDSKELKEKAVELARNNTKNKEGQLHALATLTEVLHTAGEEEEAIETFEELREGAALAQLELPTFQRLAPVAAAGGFGETDWAPDFELPEDVLGRADLAQLGPRYWTPPTAPDWKLPDAFGNELALDDHAGRPVIVIFFLGFSCVHCVEQLQAFAPEYDRFEELGIELVTIGNHPVEKLAESMGNDPLDSGYPFPVLADPDHEVFKQYRAYDDFEDTALHGTFLVDGAGRVRWMDISYEPFMDWEFLLAESERLLDLPVRSEGQRAVQAESPLTPRASAPARAEELTAEPASGGTR